MNKVITKDNNKTAKDLLYSILYQILLIALPLITTPYVSRTLGENSLGIYSYNYTIAAYFVLFCILGLTNYGSREIARNRTNKKDLNYTFSSIYYIQIILSIIINLFYIIYLFIFSENKIAGAIEFIYVFSAFFDLSWLLSGLEEFKYISIRSSLVKIFSVICIFLFVKQPNDIYIYMIILSSSILITNFLNVPLILKEKIKLVKCKMKDVFYHLKPLLILFIPIVSISFYKYFNIILLRNFHGYSETGFFSSANQLLLVPYAFTMALGNVMLPKTIRAYKEKNERKVFLFFNKSMKFVIIASVSMGFGIISVADAFVPIFYGDGFEKCIPLISILLISPLFLSIANVIRTQYLIPNNKDKEYVISIICGAAFNLSFGIVLIYKLNSIGAAIASLATEIVVCLIQIYLIRKQKFIIKSILFSIPYIIFGIIMLLVVISININFSNLVNLLIKVTIGIIVYIAMFALYEVIKRRVFKVRYENL